MQEGKPLAFYSRKLNSAQTRYTTGEQELLSIVETLKEFRDIILGQQVIVRTDHLNILHGKLSLLAHMPKRTKNILKLTPWRLELAASFALAGREISKAAIK
jgi:hypothetical protein